MSATIDAAEAGMHFARLLERAERGEEITITRRARPSHGWVPQGPAMTSRRRARRPPG